MQASNQYQAAGLITLSHASAGPLLDIAVPTSSGQVTGALIYCTLLKYAFADK